MASTRNVFRKRQILSLGNLAWAALAVVTAITVYRARLESRDRQVIEALTSAQAQLERHSDALGRPSYRVSFQGKAVAAKDLATLRRLRPAVDDLNLADTRITGPEIGELTQLTRLQKLDLSNTAVTDENLAALKELPELQEVAVGGTLLTQNGMDQFQGDGSQRRLVGAPRISEEDAALQVIRKRGGEPKHNKDLPGNPIVEVDLQDTPIIDQELEPLRHLQSLKKLNLAHTRITDEGLESLKTLGALEVLDLSGTEMTDSGLVHLKQLKQLKVLRLGTGVPSADVKGPLDKSKMRGITNKGLFNLRGLTLLEELDLTGCDITGGALRLLSQLPALKHLRLDQTGVNSELPELANLPELAYLSLRGVVTFNGAGLAALYGLNGPKNLRELDLYGTGIVTDAGVDAITKITTLKKLNLGGIGDEGRKIADQQVKKLAGIPDLEELTLSEDRGVTNDALTSLQSLKKLQKLDLSNTGVTGSVPVTPPTTPPTPPKPVTFPPQLRELRLDGCPLAEGGLRALLSISKQTLTLLSLRGCPVNFKAEAVLPQFTELKTLNLSESSFGDDALPQLHPLIKLEKLQLHKTGVTNKAFGLPNKKELIELDLRATPVAILSPDFEKTIALPALKILKLGDTQLQDGQLTFLSKLANLTELDLSDAPPDKAGVAAKPGFSARGLTPLGELKKLETLRLSGKNIENDILPLLANLRNLTALSVQGTSVNEEGILELAVIHAKMIRDLDLRESQFGNSGAKALEQFQNLRTLSLGTASLRPNDLKQLYELHQLRKLDLTGSKPQEIPPASLAPLKKALPGLSIEREIITTAPKPPG